MNLSPEIGAWVGIAIAVIIVGCGVVALFAVRKRRVARQKSGSPNQRVTTSPTVREPPEKLLASDLDVPTEASLVTDAHRRIIWSNPEFTALTGYRLPEISGRNCGMLQGPETDPQTIEEMRRMLDARLTYRGRVLNYRRDGSEFWNSLTINPLHDANGTVVNFVSVQRDISEQVARERAFIERLSTRPPAQD